MPWEPRRNGKRYYYRAASHATGGAREYVGSGPIAEMCAQLDLIERAEKLSDQQQELAFRERWGAAEQAYKRAHVSLEQIVFGALTALGYHRPKRHAWRKAQTRTKEERPMLDAEAGDSGPQVAKAADMLEAAETAWLELVAGNNPELLEPLRRELVDTEEQLAEEGDSPLIELLVRRVALCQLQTAHADVTYATRPEVSLRQARFLIERQRAAQNRLMQAIRTLSQVRRIARRTR